MNNALKTLKLSSIIASIAIISYCPISIGLDKSGIDKNKKKSPEATSQVTNVKTFQNWTYMCEPQNKDVKEKTCYVVQVVSLESVDEKTKKKISNKIADYKIGYFQNEKGKKVVKLIENLPLGSLIPPGTGLINEKGELAKGAYAFCDKNGCVAISEINEDVVKKIATSEKTVVAFLGPDGKQINIPVAREGLDDAFKHLKSN